MIKSENDKDFENVFKKLNDKLGSNSHIKTYFDNNVMGDLRQYCTQFVHSKYLAFQNYHPTNNISESMYSKVKSLLEKKKFELDEILFFIYHLQSTYLVEFC